MMKITIFINIVLILLLGIIAGCSSSGVVNDYFGIEMHPSEVDRFVIKAYTERTGISYSSTANMNPNLFAWGEFGHDYFKIILVNNSAVPITLSYDMDQYTLVLNNGEEYIFTKGDRFNYNSNDPLEPNSSVELSLDLPQNFWETVGTQNVQSSNVDYTTEFWTGQNTLNFEKEEVKYIQVKLSLTTDIILKRVPGAD